MKKFVTSLCIIGVILGLFGMLIATFESSSWAFLEKSILGLILIAVSAWILSEVHK